MSNEKIILDRRNAKKDGTFPIKIYLRNKREILIHTEYSALPDNFEDGYFNKKESNFKVKNTKLRSLLSQVETEMVSLSASGKLKSMEDKELRSHLTNALFGVKQEYSPKQTFEDCLNDMIKTKQNKGTVQTYITTRNTVESFDPKCTLESMDINWLYSFDKWMKLKEWKTNYRSFHLRNIRAVFNYAINNDLTTLYPFRKFRIKQEETSKRCLDVEQLRMLMKYECEEYQVKYRDLFVLMFYLIGINAGDLLTLKPDNYYNGRIEYHRKKTNKYYSIKVEPEAMELINKYKGEEYLLCFMDGNKDYKDILKQFNTQLKLIGSLERSGRGGKKERKPIFSNISSYWSRHTWATIAADLEIPIETISMALGHKAGYKITNIYIKFNSKKIDEANRKIIDYVLEITKKNTPPNPQ